MNVYYLAFHGFPNVISVSNRCFVFKNRSFDRAMCLLSNFLESLLKESVMFILQTHQ